MQIRRTGKTIHITLSFEEAEAVREDIGQIQASNISGAGSQLHSLLESATESETCPEPSFGGYHSHLKRGETACDGCKAKKREYDRARYAKDPRRARAPQRAYEARKRAAAA